MSIARPHQLCIVSPVEVPVLLIGGRADAGTWTPGINATGIRQVVRTAAATAVSYWIDVPTEHTNGSGTPFAFQPTGLRLLYTIGAAAANDVRVELWRRSRAAGAVTTGVLGGNNNAEYDAAHDTAAERGAIAANTEATVGLPAANQLWLDTDQNLTIRVFIDAALTTTFSVLDCVLLGNRYLQF
mgnify:CR=1 FL=1